MQTILFLEWKSFGNEFIVTQFQKLGYEVVRHVVDQANDDMRNGQETTEKLARKILEIRPVFVFSFNYFPVAAIACQACRTKYVAWVYDSPYIMLYSQTILYDTNRVFVFDRYEANRLQMLGAKNVYYLPMAAATFYYDKKIPDAVRKQKYRSDVTFIGSMYSEKKQHLFRHLENLDEYTKGYVDALMDAQKGLYGVDVIEPALTENIIEKIKKVCPVSAHGDGLETESWIIANYFLARKVTAMERSELLHALSQVCDIKLFTPEKTSFLSKVKNMGEIDYYDEAPYAMKCAKINLNISLRSIHTGMPLRVLDILGCGGFLLTNYQEDMLEYLEPGKDFVYYESVSHACELVSYYLTHEEERNQIAKNGYRKVKEQLSYEKLVSALLDRV